ncbi:MAG: GNAT family N-acetyltransferase [Haloarculaceae archaeon]
MGDYSSKVTDGGDASGETEQFPRPPFSFTDDGGRTIDVRRLDGDIGALVEMYEQMDPSDRSQGIPPRSESRRESWIGSLTDEGMNLIAWHGGVTVGHAVLMPMEVTRLELAIFVRSDYQQSHIGSNLLECLLGWAQEEEGIETVWLSVERYNDVALSLYEKVGFEKLSGDSEYKMERGI